MQPSASQLSAAGEASLSFTVVANAEYKDGFRGLIFAILLALWADGLVAIFVPNRITMACWFVLTKLAAPIGFFVVGWVFLALSSKSKRPSVVGLLCYSISLLVFVCAALPIPLGGLSLLPFGQETTLWQGRVVACPHPPLDMAEYNGRLLIVSVPKLGPNLQMRVSIDDYILAARAEDLSQLPPAEGWVVRGFTGIPVACRWKGFVPSSNQ